MSGTWWQWLIGAAAALLVAWSLLVVGLLLVRPRGPIWREALRLLPDVLRLLRRLATDPTVPRGVRVRLGLLMVYLALPIDLVPDFVPVLGHADDAIVVTLVLRGVVRRAGLEVVRGHWPGSAEGFAALRRLTGLTSSAGWPDRVGRRRHRFRTRSRRTRRPRRAEPRRGSRGRRRGR